MIRNRQVSAKWASIFLLAILLGACASHSGSTQVDLSNGAQTRDSRGQEVVFVALGLLDTGYRFGGKNPEAGLDCSGMVAYVFKQALGMNFGGSAADIANRARPVLPKALQPGDLLFFKIGGKPYSHVAIYIGDKKFVHAPSTNGKVRVDNLDSTYFSAHFQEARTLLL